MGWKKLNNKKWKQRFKIEKILLKILRPDAYKEARKITESFGGLKW